MEWIYTQTIDHIDYETAHAYVVYNIYAQTKMSGQGSLELALEMRKKERLTNGYFLEQLVLVLF